MATSLTLQNDSSLAQGYIKVNGTTAATLTTSGITGNLTGNVTGNLTGNADTATKLAGTTGAAPSYTCRAWVNFDGTRDSSGAVSTANTNRFIRSSGNVTSVLRNGTGDYTVTFTTPMTDANYAYAISGSQTGVDVSNINPHTLATGTFRFQTFNFDAPPVLRDYDFASVAIFGN
jgi:hypothetical protein